MSRSDEFIQLAQTLREAGESGQVLRLTLLRHFGELIRDLTHDLDTEPPLHSSSEAMDSLEGDLTDANSGEVPAQVPDRIALSEYGDEASLHAVRMEALEVFETRKLSAEAVVVLWIDVVHVWGRPLVLCMAATAEGYRRVLGFVEASLQDVVALQHLLQGLLERGLCPDRGLLCITAGTAALSQTLAQYLGPQICEQFCQVHKRERVISYLSDADRPRIRNAITRAFALPEPEQARAALMRIHAELCTCNRSAAQWLLRDLDPTLTLHRSGLYEQLSPSLRSTRCIAQVAQQLTRRLRGIRRWLPPQSRRAQIALLLLEMELRMRRLAHASYLPSMQSAFFDLDRSTN